MAEPRGAEGASRTNLGKNERILSVVGGGVLAALGVRAKGVRGTILGLAGATLVHRGVTGYCQVYGALGVGGSREKPAAPDAEGGFSGTAATAINRPASELYEFWRDFTTAPRFRDSITTVEMIDENTSRWTAAGPMGRSFQWTSRVTEDRPGEFIAWESIPPSDVPNRGSVRFIPFGNGRQTEVHYTVEIDTPGGVVGKAILSLFHQAPQALMEEDLRHFRQLMESGGEGAR